MRCDDCNNLLYPYMSCSFYIAVIGVEVGFHLPAKSLSTCYVFNMSHALISNAYIYIYIHIHDGFSKARFYFIPGFKITLQSFIRYAEALTFIAKHMACKKSVC